MSLRAIQKRDRNKLSSAQQKQQQQQQQLFINKSRSSSFGTTVTAAPLGIGALSSSVGGHHQHRQPSSASNSSSANNRNEKWRNSSSQASLSSSTSIPSAQQLLTHAKRSVSYPSLQKRGSTHSALRFTKSESDLCRGASTANGQSPSRGPSDLTNSTNNLYLGAKSEVCLKTLAVKSTHQPPAPFRRQSVSAGRPAPGGNRMYESNRRTSDLGVGGGDKLSGINHGGGVGGAVRIPIIGYEVMEERARFTIFKLRIENSISHTCWLVLRRYTDFVRLHNRLRVQFAHCQLVLPRKKWFGDNFSSGFIDNRIQGLQTFINTILEDDAMRTTPAVREFFCLDEPPAYSESMEESRIIFEAQEETISHLKQQLQTKDELVAALQAKLASEINRNKVLTSVIRNSFENCSKCAKQLDNHLKEAAYK